MQAQTRCCASQQTQRRHVRAAPLLDQSLMARPVPAAAAAAEERSVWLADTTRKLGLLLPKFDAVPSARAELISLTEEVIARGLT